LLSAKTKVEKYIEGNEIDIVHTHGIRADGFLKNIEISKISTIHNDPKFDYLSKFGKVKGGLMLFTHMNTIKANLNNCIACSKTIAKTFKKYDLILGFIQNGVDIQKYKILPADEKLELRDKLSLSTEKKVMITVGSLIYGKDMKTVIEGFKLYNIKNDAILLIAGDGLEKENLQAISNENIIFLGNISNVVEYLQISDCFVSASLAEGLPNTVLEAMACGLPTVLSAIPSHAELFEDENVEFFKIKDTQKLSELLQSVSNNFEKKQALSLKMIREKFSAKVMSQKYQKVYMEKLDESI